MGAHVVMMLKRALVWKIDPTDSPCMITACRSKARADEAIAQILKACPQIKPSQVRA